MKKEEKNTEEKNTNYSKQGKLNRAAGQRFEAKVRAGLEELGWIIDRWTNTVDYNREGQTGKVVPAKRKYNPFKKVMVVSTGFPDFIAFRNSENGKEIIGVEVKRNGYLDQIEKGMCHWLLDNNIFSKILIAKAGEKRGEVEYLDFKEKYKKE